MNKIMTLAVFGILIGGIGTANIANAQAPAPGFGMGPQMGRGPQQGFGMVHPQAQRGPQAVGPQAQRQRGVSYQR